MTAKEMFQLREEGKTYQEIADEIGKTRQWVHQAITNYTKRVLTSYRGKGFYLENIKYQGIFEHFLENEGETISSFTSKVYDTKYPSRTSTIRGFITGKQDSYFTIEQIKRICDVVGKPFEEVFKEREDYVQ